MTYYTVIIEATQWFKNGDHPDDYKESQMGFVGGHLKEYSGEYRREHGWEGSVVRYYRRLSDDGERICSDCGCTMHDHGLLNPRRDRKTVNEEDDVVCPGDWIITDLTGNRFACKPEVFDLFIGKLQKRAI